MLLFGMNLESNISIKASKKATVLELDQHGFNANKAQIKFTVWLGYIILYLIIIHLYLMIQQINKLQYFSSQLCYRIRKHNLDDFIFFIKKVTSYTSHRNNCDSLNPIYWQKKFQHIYFGTDFNKIKNGLKGHTISIHVLFKIQFY